MGDRDVLERILSGQEKPTDLALPLLQEITENFSEKRKIGEGGFGEVYKGVLGNKIVAVKRIIVSQHTIDDKLFDQEVKNLMKIIISHRNVVRFLGYCSNTHREVTKFTGSAEYVFVSNRERLLCFEYISNRSLDKHITDELRGLEWSIRYKIINGICHGLHYLHEENNIIHMDLKPGNIMLDDDMVPKITDFGLSRLDKKTHTSGIRYITQGYCAPEYENGGKTSKKADMYSLGLTIIELVTGRKDEPDIVNVLRRWRHRWDNSPKHLLSCQCQQVTTCLDIAALCRKKEPADRPSILDIIGILSKTDTTNEHTDHPTPYSDDDMLGIEPLELRFPLELQKRLPSKVKLINKTKHYYAFNIKAPCRQYHIEPNKGIVSPDSKCIVQITMQTQETALLGMSYTGDFIVQSTKVNSDLRAEDITEHVFNKDPGDVDEVNLMVVVSEPGEPKGDLKSQEDTKKKRKMMDESPVREDKPSVSATQQVKEIPKDINPISYEYVLGKCIEQLERMSFRTTPSISFNQQTNMSDIAVDLATGAMGSLRHKLGDLLKREHNLEMNMKEEIESLSEELRDMQLALHKVLEIHRNHLNDQVKRWADSVREMSYDIEDVVDGLSVHVEHATDMGIFMALIEKMSKLFTWGKTHNPIEDAIKHIQKQVQGLADRRKKYKVDEVVANLDAAVTIDTRILNIYKDQNQLVGIKEPRSVLIRWLSHKDRGGDVSKQLKFVSIVGFGGLGKTTLAKAVYDKLESKFSHGAFIPVGRNPNVKKVFESILHGLGYDSNAENLNEMQLIDKIRGLLKKKRYFIVIDDIWDSSAWDIIKCAFIEDNCGSIVVITTRIRSVADDCCIHSRGYVHEMKPLNDKDSRKLFSSRIFGSQEAWHNVPDEILNEILKKCGGLPLAIISIASLLAHNPRSRWHSIKDSLVSMFAENHGDLNLKYMEQVLDLSYTHLPHRLKTCLLDIGKYREDIEIKKKDLLKQWTAQGFVSASRLRDAEDVAEGYFCELINMNMIQPGKRDYNDEVLSCRVHDIMLDLIRSKAAEQNFNLVIDGPKVVASEHRVRRVTIHYAGEEDGEILGAINGSSMSHVRSVLLFRGSLVPSFLALKYIRVLFIKDLRCERLDLSSICGLFLLRYIKIYCSKYLTLPCQIGELRQLETIEVKPWVAQLDGPICLPSDIVTLPRLSHLSFSRDVVLPDGIGRLKSMRTLRLPHVDFLNSSVDDFKGLGELTNLRELEMASGYFFQDNEVKMRIDALWSSIGKLSCSLSSLSIGSRDSVDVDDWSSTLTPPRRLWKLELYRWEFQRIPRWIDQLKDLNRLTLIVREVADVVSIAGGLLSLTYLDLSTSMGEETEERVIISGTGFGALKYLNWECPYASLVFQPGALPRLEELRICFRPSISKEFLPVDTKHMPVGTLRRIHLVVSDYFERHDDDDYHKKEAARLLLTRAFKPHRRAAVITVEFYSDE